MPKRKPFNSSTKQYLDTTSDNMVPLFAHSDTAIRSMFEGTFSLRERAACKAVQSRQPFNVWKSSRKHSPLVAHYPKAIRSKR